MKLSLLNGPISCSKVVLTKEQLEERLVFLEGKRVGLEKLGLIFETFVPSDSVNRDKDVAFGITRSMDYLDAAMVTDPDGNTPPKSGMGLVSHGQLLELSGKSGAADDPKPTDDYVVRGVVKANLGGVIVFWESNRELLYRISFVRKVLEKLLDRGLVSDMDEVWGAHEKTMLAHVYEIFQD